MPTIELVLLVIILVGVAVIGCIIALARYETPEERAYRQLREAAAEVQDVFSEVQIAMEEASGRRGVGERRIKDGLRGSSMDW